MPRPTLPTEVVDLVVELLLCEWTPQDIVSCWPKPPTVRVTRMVAPSISAIQKLARDQGLAGQKGGSRANSGGSRVGSGRKPSGPGSGAKHTTHAKWSPRRAEASRLRDEGLSYAVIAGILGITRQGVQKILSDDS
jgi:hypothetical protein